MKRLHVHARPEFHLLADIPVSSEKAAADEAPAAACGATPAPQGRAVGSAVIPASSCC